MQLFNLKSKAWGRKVRFSGIVCLILSFCLSSGSMIFASTSTTIYFHTNYPNGNDTYEGIGYRDNTDQYLPSLSSARLKGKINTPSGYKFLGWGASKSSTQYYEAGHKFTTSWMYKNLYAIWGKLYSVTLNKNGADGNLPSLSRTEYVKGETFSIPGRGTLKKDKAVFLGWSETSHGLINRFGTKPAILSGKYTMSAKNVRLYAVWAMDSNENSKADYSETKYTLSYDSNLGDQEGLLVTLPQSHEHLITGDTVTLRSLSDVTTKDGDSLFFMGWSLDKRDIVENSLDTAVISENTIYPKGSDFTMSSKNVIMYAVWLRATQDNILDIDNMCTLTYEGNGETRGTVPEQLFCLKGTNAALSSAGDLEREKTVFIGWSEEKKDPVDRKGGEPESFYREGDIYPIIKKNSVLYAVWAVDKDENGVADYEEENEGHTESGGSGDRNEESSNMIFVGSINNKSGFNGTFEVTNQDGNTMVYESSYFKGDGSLNVTDEEHFGYATHPDTEGGGGEKIYLEIDPTLKQGIDTGTWEETDDIWYYRFSSGELARNGFALIKTGDGHFYWFYFDKDGQMITGWIFAGGKEGDWYYASIDNGPQYGAIEIGWIYLMEDKRTYYMSEVNGKMMTGWLGFGDTPNDIPGYYYFATLYDTPRQNWYFATTASYRWTYDQMGFRSWGALYVNELTPDGYETGPDGLCKNG